MKFGMGDIMQQAKEMQARVEQMQRDMASLEVTGEAGAGLVKVVMTGQHDVKRLTIDDAVYESDKAMLEDLIAAAINDANRRVEKVVQEKQSALTGGFKLPL